jgi:hypothetical protein
MRFFKSNNKVKFKKLCNHPFFTSMNYWINIEINNLQIQNKLKKNVATVFLKLQFKLFVSNLKCFIEDENNCNNLSTVEQIIIDAINECDERAKNLGIPRIFVDKFRKWNHQHTEIAFNAVSSICESKIYSTDAEKMAAILDILLAVFKLTIVDIEKTIGELNGELEKALKGTIYDY